MVLVIDILPGKVIGDLRHSVLSEHLGFLWDVSVRENNMAASGADGVAIFKLFPRYTTGIQTTNLRMHDILCYYTCIG